MTSLVVLAVVNTLVVLISNFLILNVIASFFKFLHARRHASRVEALIPTELKPWMIVQIACASLNKAAYIFSAFLDWITIKCSTVLTSKD